MHTEFDVNGNAYTSFFVSSEVVKWNVKDLKVLDRQSTYYSVGHLMVPGGNTEKPMGKYLVAYNKITKDRYLPTGIFPIYCTDFCSALDQEMQGYVRVSPKGSNVPISYSLGKKAKDNNNR